MITYLGIELKLSNVPVSKTPWILWRNEYWKWIVGYDGRYMISSQGRVKSFLRNNITGNILVCRHYPGKRYLEVGLRVSSNSIKKRKTVHRLVLIEFGSDDNLVFDENLQVNHKNKISTDNRIENLEWANRRENTTHWRSYSKKKKSSKFTGVHFYSRDNKWGAIINENRTRKHLGCYNTEEEAAKAYKLEFNNRGLTNRYAVLIED